MTPDFRGFFTLFLWLFIGEENMESIYERTEMLLGKEAITKLKAATVCVFGVGGVGSFAAEALARAGVGTIVLVDSEKISPSNVNRQIHATSKTVGQYKTEAMKQRINEINPDIKAIIFTEFYGEKTWKNLISEKYSYIVDAIDTVTSKIHLICKAKELNISIISAMGSGNKLDPTKFEVSDINKTSMCPLARVMRRELKARGIEHLKVVYSKEPPRKPLFEPENSTRRATPASVSFVPPVAGMIMAGEIIKDITDCR
jgi:tRNA A37 threonylcarbamoyladenosine dehydratase